MSISYKLSDKTDMYTKQVAVTMKNAVGDIGRDVRSVGRGAAPHKYGNLEKGIEMELTIDGNRIVATVDAAAYHNGYNYAVNMHNSNYKLGKLIIGIDFSQIEPRVLAHMSGDEQLQQAYKDGRDLYATVAATVYGKKYGLTYEQCLEADQDSYKKVGLTIHPRKLFKTSLLSIMYETSAYSLAQQAGITVDEAQEMIDDFHNSFPQAYQYAKDCIVFVDEHGYTTTSDGRKRRFSNHVKTAKEYHRLYNRIKQILGRDFDNIFSEKQVPYELKQKFFPVMKDYNAVVRQVVNARTQGSAADIMKKAMIALYEHLQQKGSEWKMIGTIHDEVLLEVPNTITAVEIAELENCQKNCVQLDVPLKVDTEISRRWGQGVDKSDFLAERLDCWDEKGWLK